MKALVLTNHAIPEILLPTFRSLNQSDLQFLKVMDDYFHFKSIAVIKVTSLNKSIKDEFSKMW